MPISGMFVSLATLQPHFGQVAVSASLRARRSHDSLGGDLAAPQQNLAILKAQDARFPCDQRAVIVSAIKTDKLILTVELIAIPESAVKTR